MTSSKCRQCGLVNPIHVSACKRCGFSLTADGTPNTPPEAVQKTVAAQDEQPGVQSFQTAPPAVCSICGTNNDVAVRSFQRTHTPGWVWLFLPVGILIAGILAFALQVKHNLKLPVCTKCNQRHSWTGVVSWLSIIACIFLLFPVVGLAIQFQSGFVFLAGCGVIATIAYLAGWYDRKANPRYTQFTKARVEIDVPGQGRILVFDQTASIGWAGHSSAGPTTA
jgi:ribosomal protein L40E